jgi:hypothetical protein
MTQKSSRKITRSSNQKPVVKVATKKQVKQIVNKGMKQFNRTMKSLAKR